MKGFKRDWPEPIATTMRRAAALRAEMRVIRAELEAMPDRATSTEGVAPSDDLLEKANFVASVLEMSVVGDDETGELAEWVRPGFLRDDPPKILRALSTELVSLREKLSYAEAERDLFRQERDVSRGILENVRTMARDKGLFL